jgi:adenosylcobinamide-GDP ribazoletransferase
VDAPDQQNGVPPNAWGPLAPLGEAIRFLTVVPVPGLPPMSETTIARAIPLFPVVGLLIGGLLATTGALAGLLWGEAVRAVLIVVVWGIVTGGLHLDGLSDTFDAVMSWRPRERKLEIMKDSRIGAMGALALAAVLAAWLGAALLAPVLGRWADTYGIIAFPAAREGGLGRGFQAQIRRNDVLLASATALVLALAVAGLRGLVALLLVWLAAWLLARWWVRDLGGLTGDTYGALCEIGEVVALAALTATLNA